MDKRILFDLTRRLTRLVERGLRLRPATYLEPEQRQAELRSLLATVQERVARGDQPQPDTPRRRRLLDTCRQSWERRERMPWLT